ncbi:MAG: hypothetical protein H5T78_03110 [Nocardia sp.]|nr:hypothetical protein [Nocardia sp.]
MLASSAQLLGHQPDRGVVVGMFTDDELVCLAALNLSSTTELDDMRELIARHTPHDVVVVAVAPVRTASAVWEAADALATELAAITTIVTITRYYTHSLRAGSPVIELGATGSDHEEG